MQTALSRIWTKFDISISNVNNHYTTGTSVQMKYRRNITFLEARKQMAFYMKGNTESSPISNKNNQPDKYRVLIKTICATRTAMSSKEF